jgi:TRAP-type mannitol/chloroaromatic compound transport system permease small subunit
MKEVDNLTRIPPICCVIDAFIRRCGVVLAWLSILLIAAILLQVVLRYGFGHGMVSLEEFQWHLFGVLIIFGYGYCITEDAHIRLDLFHRRFSPRTRELIDVLGHILLLLPLLFVLFFHGLDFVESAWRVGERSDSPLGLPWRWLIKAVIPVGMVFAALAVGSRIIRSLAILCKKP